MAKPTVLVVDHDEVYRRLFSDALTRDELYQVEAVSSGQEAIQRMAQGGVDLLLTGFYIPECDGLELLKHSRQGGVPPEIILTTEAADTEAAVAALHSGTRELLVKPCSPDLLRHRVKVSLERHRLLEENRQLRTENRLYRNGQSLASQLEIDQLFGEALSVLLSEVGSDRGLAFVMHKNNLSFYQATPGIDEQAAKSLAGHFARRCEESQQAVQLQKQDLEGIHPLPDDLRSAWLFPLHASHDMLGAVVLFNRFGTELPLLLPQDNRLFLAEQLALGFRNACQYQGTRELIYTDDLTDLFNQRYLKIAIEQELHRAERYGLEFTLAFIDLDLFKNINDSYGHLVGSNLLREVGLVLRECVREADMLFRYGGDEFTALLVETDSNGARVVAERIRRRLENHKFTVKDDQTCSITATVGHATYPIHATTLHDMIELADKAMYQGKTLRNATCSASEIRRSG